MSLRLFSLKAGCQITGAKTGKNSETVPIGEQRVTRLSKDLLQTRLSNNQYWCYCIFPGMDWLLVIYLIFPAEVSIQVKEQVFRNIGGGQAGW